MKARVAWKLFSRNTNMQPSECLKSHNTRSGSKAPLPLPPNKTRCMSGGWGLNMMLLMITFGV